LGKKCYSLRVASKMARDEEVKWMAEHMVILRVTRTPFTIDPETKKKKALPVETYTITAAFPSACGKTNLAMLEVPPEFRDEWKVTCVGDDIAWIRVDPEGRMCAINPESGFFGVAPGTSDTTNKNAMDTLRLGNSIFTNVAVTKDGDVFWEGKSKVIPKGLIDWKGKAYEDDCWKDANPEEEKKKKKAVEKGCAHPNSRYTTPCSQCPIIDSDWNTGKGYPIDAMLFGGRRTTLMPLAVRTDTWEQGVLAAATMRSEGTAAVQDRVMGKLSFDPMAMRPFIGYNWGDYFAHWLEMGERAPKRPDIYCVNWFRKSEKGEFLWEGFSQNFRVIQWACLNAKARRENDASASPSSTASPLGFVPTPAALNLDLTTPAHKKILVDPTILSVDPTSTEMNSDWFTELSERKEYLSLLRSDLPDGIKKEFNLLVDKFHKAGLTVPKGKSVDELKF